MAGKRKARQEWSTIKRVRLTGDDAYHLKRTGDDSTWLAVRLDQERGFFANLLKRIEKMEAMLDAIGSDRTKSISYIQSRQIIRCPRCNSTVNEDHNYCSSCGTRIRI